MDLLDLERMINRISDSIVAWLIDKQVIDEEERELYKYATFNCIFTLLPFLTIIPFCLMTGTIINGIVVVMTFLTLRKYTGGYHAKTPMKCWLYSSLLMIGLIYGTTIIENNSIITIFVLIAVCSIWIFSPIDSDNRKLDVSERKTYRTHSRCVSLVLFLFYVVLSILSKNALAIMFATGIMFASVLQLIGLLEQYLNEHCSHIREK